MNFVEMQNQSGHMAVLAATVLLTVIALVVSVPPAMGQAAQIANINLVLSGTSIQPTAVNDGKYIVGTYTTNSGSPAGFLYNPVTATTQSIVCQGADNYTRAIGINSGGTIVGDYFGKDGVYHGYTYNALIDQCETFPFPGFNEQHDKFSVTLFGISDNNNYAGAASPDGSTEGFVQVGGEIYQFYVKKGSNTYAVAINNSGTSVGEYFVGNVAHGFSRASGGRVTLIDYPGSASTQCTGISNTGVIVGEYSDALGNYYGFSYTPGQNGGPATYATTDVYAYGISSNLGYTTGSYLAPGGVTRAFLGFPQNTGQDAPTPITIPGGAESISVYGVDAALDVAGGYIDLNGVGHGMLLTAKQVLTTIDNPNASGDSTVCQGLSSPSNIACNYYDANSNSHGAVYNATTKTWTEISISNASFVILYGISANNDLAGTFVDFSGKQHGFLMLGVNGPMTQLDAPGATFTVGTGINSQEVVTAFWGDSAGNVESSVYFLGQWVKENLPGATNAYISGIDDQNDLTYTWTDPQGDIHAGFETGALAKGSAYYLWDVPGGFGTRAYGVVSSSSLLGQFMVGRYYPTASSIDFGSYEWNLLGAENR